MAMKSYTKNLMRSLGYISVDMAKKAVPNITNTAETVMLTADDAMRELRKQRVNMRRATTAINRESVFGTANNVMKDIKLDLASGKFYAGFRDTSLNLDGDELGWDDIDSSYDEEEDPDARESKKETLRNRLVSHENRQNAEMITKTVIGTGEAMMSQSKAMNTLFYSQNLKNFSTLNNNMKAINDNLINNLAEIQAVQKSQMENATNYYTQSIDIQKKQLAILEEIKKSGESGTKEQRKFGFDRVLNGDSLNMKEYKRYVMGNFNNEIFDTGELSMLKTGIQMLAENKKEGGGRLVNNPLSFIPALIMKGIMPETMSKTIKNFDQMFENLPRVMLRRLSRMKYSDNGLAEIIGTIFGVESDGLINGRKMTSKYNKGKVPWDGKSKKALEEVIPGYLAQITAALTKQDARVFDYDTGKYRTLENIKKEEKENFTNYAKDAYNDFYKNATRLISKLDMDTKEKEKQNKYLVEMMEYMFKNDRIADDDTFRDLKRMNYGDEDTYAIAKAILNFEGKQMKSINRVKGVNRLEATKSKYNNRLNKDESQVQTWLYNNLLAINGDVQSGSVGGKNNLFNNILEVRDKHKNSLFDYLKMIADNTSNLSREDARGGKSTIGRNVRNSNEVKTSKKPRARESQSQKDEGAAPSSKSSIKPKPASKKITKNLAPQLATSNVADLIGDTKTDRGIISKLNIANKVGEFFDDSPIGTSITKGIITASSVVERILIGNDNAEAKPLVDILRDIFNNPDDDSKLGKFFKEVEEKNSSDSQLKDMFKILYEKLKKKILDNEYVQKGIKFGKEVKKETINNITAGGRAVVGSFKGVKNDISEKLDDETSVFGAIKKSFIESHAVGGRIGDGHNLNKRPNGSAGKRYDNEVNFVNKVRSAIFNDDYIHLANGSNKRMKKNGKKISDPEKYNELDSKYKALNNEVITVLSKGEAVLTPEELAEVENMKKELKKLKRERNRYYKPANSEVNIKTPNQDKEQENPETTMDKLLKIYDVNGVYDTILNSVFGINRSIEKKTKDDENLRTIRKDIFNTFKKNSSKVAAGGLMGAIVSTALGVVGGPLAGMAVGAGVSLYKSSDNMKTLLFGDAANDKKGIIPQSAVDIVKKYFPDFKKYGLTGAALGLLPMTSFGPVGGLMLGSAISFFKNNETAQNELFGSQGLFGSHAKELLTKHSKGVLTGAAAGALFGPLGLMGNVMMGSSIALLASTDTFKKGLIGEKDEDGNYQNGILPSLRDQVVLPLKDFALKVPKKASKFLLDEVAKPIKYALNPIKAEITGVFKRGRRKLGKLVGFGLKHYIYIPIYKKLEDVIIKPLKKVANTLFKGLTGFIKKIVLAPVNLISGIGSFFKDRQIARGDSVAYMTAGERLNYIATRQKLKPKVNKKLIRTDQVLQTANVEQLEKLKELVYNSDAERAKTSAANRHSLKLASSKIAAVSDKITSHDLSRLRKGYKNNWSEEVWNKELRAIAIKRKLSPEELDDLIRRVKEHRSTVDNVKSSNAEFIKAQKEKLQNAFGVDNLFKYINPEDLIARIDTEVKARRTPDGTEMSVDKRMEKDAKIVLETTKYQNTVSDRLAMIINLLAGKRVLDVEGVRKTNVDKNLMELFPSDDLMGNVKDPTNAMAIQQGISYELYDRDIKAFNDKNIRLKLGNKFIKHRLSHQKILDDQERIDGTRPMYGGGSQRYNQLKQALDDREDALNKEKYFYRISPDRNSVVRMINHYDKNGKFTHRTPDMDDPETRRVLEEVVKTAELHKDDFQSFMNVYEEAGQNKATDPLDEIDDVILNKVRNFKNKWKNRKSKKGNNVDGLKTSEFSKEDLKSKLYDLKNSSEDFVKLSKKYPGLLDMMMENSEEAHTEKTNKQIKDKILGGKFKDKFGKAKKSVSGFFKPSKDSSELLSSIVKDGIDNIKYSLAGILDISKDNLKRGDRFNNASLDFYNYLKDNVEDTTASVNKFVEEKAKDGGRKIKKESKGIVGGLLNILDPDENGPLSKVKELLASGKNKTTDALDRVTKSVSSGAKNAKDKIKEHYEYTSKGILKFIRNDHGGMEMDDKDAETRKTLSKIEEEEKAKKDAEGAKREKIFNKKEDDGKEKKKGIFGKILGALGLVGGAAKGILGKFGSLVGGLGKAVGGAAGGGSGMVGLLTGGGRLLGSPLGILGLIFLAPFIHDKILPWVEQNFNTKIMPFLTEKAIPATVDIITKLTPYLAQIIVEGVKTAVPLILKALPTTIKNTISGKNTERLAATAAGIKSDEVLIEDENGNIIADPETYNGGGGTYDGKGRYMPQPKDKDGNRVPYSSTNPMGNNTSDNQGYYYNTPQNKKKAQAQYAQTGQYDPNTQQGENGPQNPGGPGRKHDSYSIVKSPVKPMVRAAITKGGALGTRASIPKTVLETGRRYAGVTMDKLMGKSVVHLPNGRIISEAQYKNLVNHGIDPLKILSKEGAGKVAGEAAEHISESAAKKTLRQKGVEMAGKGIQKGTKAFTRKHPLLSAGGFLIDKTISLSKAGRQLPGVLLRSGKGKRLENVRDLITGNDVTKLRGTYDKNAKSLKGIYVDTKKKVLAQNMEKRTSAAMEGLATGGKKGLREKIVEKLNKIILRFVKFPFIRNRIPENAMNGLAKGGIQQMGQMIGDAVMKTLASKAGEGAVKGVAKQGARAGAKLVSSILSFGLVDIAFYAWDIYQGWHNAYKYLQVSKDLENQITPGMRFVSALSNFLSGAVTFGLVPTEVFVKIYKVVASKIFGDDKIDKLQQKSSRRIAAYNKKVSAKDRVTQKEYDQLVKEGKIDKDGNPVKGKSKTIKNDGFFQRTVKSFSKTIEDMGKGIASFASSVKNGFKSLFTGGKGPDVSDSLSTLHNAGGYINNLNYAQSKAEKESREVRRRIAYHSAGGYSEDIGGSYYSQRDNRWGNKRIGNDSISNAGCGPTSLAMAISDTTGKKITPDKIANDNKENLPGYATWKLFPSAAKKYGLGYNRVAPNEKALSENLKHGEVVLSGLRSSNTSPSNSPFTNAGHIVVAKGMSNGKVQIADPRGKNYNRSYNVNDVLKDMTLGFRYSKNANAGTGEDLIPYSGHAGTAVGETLDNRTVLEGAKAKKEIEKKEKSKTPSGAGAKIGDKVVAFAKEMKPKVRYVYGADSFTRENGGTGDCSAFTKFIYKEAAGVSLPRSSSEQRGVGKAVDISKVGSGDLACYDGHVGIFMNNKGDVIHNSMPGTNVTVGTYKQAGNGKQVYPRRVLPDDQIGEGGLQSSGVGAESSSGGGGTADSGGGDPFGYMFGKIASGFTNATAKMFGLKIFEGSGESDSSNSGSASGDNSTQDSGEAGEKMKLNRPDNTTAEQIDAYLRKMKATPDWTGQMFKDAQKATGISPVDIMVWAALESNWGKSRIARTKHNYFGIGAVDNNPMGGAYTFSPRDGIVEGAKWINRNYVRGKYKQDNWYDCFKGPTHRYSTTPSEGTSLAKMRANFYAWAKSAGKGPDEIDSLMKNFDETFGYKASPSEEKELMKYYEAGGADDKDSGSSDKYPDNLNGFPYYSQCDPRWNKNGMNMTWTGCGPTSTAIVATAAMGKRVTPLETGRAAIKHGLWSGNNASSHSIFPVLGKEFGFEAVPNKNNKEFFDNASKKIVQFAVGTGASPFTSGGHYVVALGADENGKIVTNNPISKATSQAFDKSRYNVTRVSWHVNKNGKPMTWDGHTEVSGGDAGGTDMGMTKQESQMQGADPFETVFGKIAEGFTTAAAKMFGLKIPQPASESEGGGESSPSSGSDGAGGPGIYRFKNAVYSVYNEPNLSWGGPHKKNVVAAHNMTFGTKVSIPKFKGKAGGGKFRGGDGKDYDLGPEKNGVFIVADNGGPYFDFDINAQGAINGKGRTDVDVLEWGTGGKTWTWTQAIADAQRRGSFSYSRPAFANYAKGEGFKTASLTKFGTEDANNPHLHPNKAGSGDDIGTMITKRAVNYTKAVQANPEEFNSSGMKVAKSEPSILDRFFSDTLNAKKSSAFGERNVAGYGDYHTGVDYDTFGKARPILSPVEGQVIRTGFTRENGKSVVIKDWFGNTHHFDHLTSRNVNPGQIIQAYDIIGRAGDTGHAKGTHLHYEIMDKKTQSMDPDEYLKMYGAFGGKQNTKVNTNIDKKVFKDRDLTLMKRNRSEDNLFNQKLLQLIECIIKLLSGIDESNRASSAYLLKVLSFLSSNGDKLPKEAKEKISQVSDKIADNNLSKLGASMRSDAAINKSKESKLINTDIKELYDLMNDLITE